MVNYIIKLKHFVTHASNNNISDIPTPMNWKVNIATLIMIHVAPKSFSKKPSKLSLYSELKPNNMEYVVHASSVMLIHLLAINQ